VADDTTTTLKIPPGDEDGPPVEGRGRTTIADKVLERIACRIALDVPGVVRHHSGPDLGPLGSDLPSASAESAGDRIRLGLQVAVDWDAPAHEVAARVREEVRRRLGDATGKAVDRVDVIVAALVPTGRQQSTDRRRVQ
jgi:uncharacterized alkaline shock family protein YloU